MALFTSGSGGEGAKRVCYITCTRPPGGDQPRDARLVQLLSRCYMDQSRLLVDTLLKGSYLHNQERGLVPTGTAITGAQIFNI